MLVGGHAPRIAIGAREFVSGVSNLVCVGRGARRRAPQGTLCTRRVQRL